MPTISREPPDPRHEAAAAAHFVVLGIGGLGCPALLGLTSGGARSITIFDHDRVDASNLQRQVLFAPSDVGVPKVRAAASRLRARVRGLELVAVERKVVGDLLDQELSACPADAIVLECTDDPALKFAVNDHCVARGQRLVVAGVLGWTGQAMAVAPGRACYRCLYEAPPPRELAPACAAAGIVGTTAGHLGMLMASLALALAREGAESRAGAHTFDSPAGSLIDLDLLASQIRTLRPSPRVGCAACARAPSPVGPVGAVN